MIRRLCLSLCLVALLFTAVPQAAEDSNGTTTLYYSCKTGWGSPTTNRFWGWYWAFHSYFGFSGWTCGQIP